MAVNRLEEELRRHSGHINNLVDTNFHNAGFKPPRTTLERGFAAYLETRHYTPDPKGLLEAREVIARFYEAAGVTVDTEALLLTASSSEAYSLIFSQLASPGDNVLLPSPGYPLFEYIADFNRLECRYYRMRFSEGFSINSDRLEAMIDERTRVIVLISPHNPTGHVASTAEITALCRIAADRGIVLLCDEVFASFLHTSHTLARPAAWSHSSETVGGWVADHGGGDQGGPGGPRNRSGEPVVLTLNGISKMFAAPELKLGWIAVSGPERARAEIVERLAFANDMFLSCSVPAQTMVPYLFAETAEFRREMQSIIRARRALLLEELESISGLSLVRPEGGIHCVIQIPDSTLDDEELALTLLRKEGQYAHPGYFYRIEEECCLVLSMLPPMERLKEGAAAIRRLVGRVQQRDIP